MAMNWMWQMWVRRQGQGCTEARIHHLSSLTPYLQSGSRKSSQSTFTLTEFQNRNISSFIPHHHSGHQKPLQPTFTETQYNRLSTFTPHLHSGPRKPAQPRDRVLNWGGGCDWGKNRGGRLAAVAASAVSTASVAFQGFLSAANALCRTFEATRSCGRL